MVAISAFQLSCCEEYIRISLNDQQFDANGKIHNELQRQFCQTGSINILVDENIKGKFVRILFWINPALCVKMFSIWLRLKRVKMKLQGIKV